MNLRWDYEGDWDDSGGSKRRGAAPQAASSTSLNRNLKAELERVGIEVAIQRDVIPKTWRGVERRALDFTVDCGPGERAVSIIRHPSGALTFHAPAGVGNTLKRRSASVSLPFYIELAEQAPLRRGIISSAIKLVVVKVKEKLIDAAVSAGLEAVSVRAETLWWRQRQLTEGWHRIASTGNGIELVKAKPSEIYGERCLLFLHGTFSDTLGSFGAMLHPPVMAKLQQRYGGRIFGFEHFSVSRSPEENARALLEFLPDREHQFDVVSYSRGGVVLRTLVEKAEGFGKLSPRFRLNHGILVAVPNGGTPLATGRRWEETFGVLAMLLDMVPDSPLTPVTTAGAFIADGLVWLAGHLSGDLPGLQAMDMEGSTISALQQRGRGAGPSYSAIGANYHPSASVWQKLLDTGVDGFFSGANDLVVPSDGALTVDDGEPRVIPPERVACFGPGGNIRVSAGDIHHLSISGQPETADFVLRALESQRHEWPLIDLSQPRPSRKPWRGGAPAPIRLGGPSRDSRRAQAIGEILHPNAPQSTFELVQLSEEREGDRTLHLMIISGRDATDQGSTATAAAQIVATYGSARVVEPFGLRDADGKQAAGTRFREIINLDTRIQMNLEGRVSKRDQRVPQLPTDDELRGFGELLFETLFTTRVRRLYDLARAEQRGRPLNIVFTCMIPWVAAKPWEFSFDPDRRKFLATEEIHFVRNVLTSVPAQRPAGPCERLRLLVVEAQPAGTAELAIEEEEQQIRFRFKPLIDAGLVEVDVVAQATPGSMHEKILQRQLEKRPYDIVHFIGHGEFDREASQGRLLFYSEAGHQVVEIQTLRELLCNRGIQLVYLNACDTARDGNQKLNRGVATALVEGGLPAVVANQYKVLDPSAVAFAQLFYWALANGASVGEAAREARIAVNYSLDGEIIDWAVPVIYTRDPDRRFCSPKSLSAPLIRHAARPGSISKPKPTAVQPAFEPLKVGVADLGRYFTGLEEILARLNAVQQRFVFRLVEINTPMGVWERDPNEEITYLYAERFADKLREKPKALGVDLLGCITNWWMRDDDTFNIYGWWSGSVEQPILIFSTAGLALPTRGPAAGRVVANELVCGIACHLAAANGNDDLIHKGKPKDCPFFYNADRDVQSVVGPLRICSTSRAAILKALPKEVGPESTLKALEALLDAYDDLPHESAAFGPPKAAAPSRSTRKRKRKR